MKKMRFFALAAAGCLALYSCSDDDDNNNGNADLDNDLTGTYELSRLVVPTAQDFDNDGDSSTNLVLEGECYNSSWISFKADGTYEQHFTWTTLAEGGAALDCETEVATGTYTQNGSSVTTTQVTGDVDLSATYSFDADAHKLTATQTGGSYVGWNSVASLFTQLTGNLQLEFTKYTENENDNGNGQSDEDNVNVSALADVVGDFNLSSFLVAQAQDLDNDGESSANLMLESDCYSDSSITFNADGTYERTITQNVVGILGTSLDCETETEAGWWTRQGDQVYMHRLSGNSLVSTALALDTAANTLLQTNDNWPYPSFNSMTSLFTMLTGSVGLEYTQE